MQELRNPWLDLPASAPFVAPVDAPTLKRLDGRLTGAFSLRVDLRPQPWTGNLNTAELFLLALNPGFKDDDYTDLRDPDYSEQWRLALSFELARPFTFLIRHSRRAAVTRGHRRLRDLIDAAGMEAVSCKVMCVEHFPYKSTSYKPLGAILPSQQYSFGVIRQAMDRGKQIVVMRSERVWLESVPELRNYPYIRLSNNQNPYVSRSQMAAEQFDRLISAMQR